MKINNLFSFIEKSPTSYHAVSTVKDILLGEGYTELYEKEDYKLVSGSKYFVCRNGSSLIAFRYNGEARGFAIVASHSDSPSFRVKGGIKSAYTKLDTERYGGMILYSWLDRPLGVAGRVVVKSADGLLSRLVSGETSLVIPSVAIHLNRGVNDGYKFNPAVDMLPLYSSAESDFFTSLYSENGIDKDSVVSHDLYLYNKEKGRLFGEGNSLVLCPRLDDLALACSSLDGFLSATDTDTTPVYALFDNEEVGSSTKQGAASTFLSDTLYRISKDREVYLKALSNSFMISADNAHARHPNHPELSDRENAPVLSGGVVIKYNASQRYATDAVSAAVFKTVCERAGVKTQNYYNRADLPGGSTLGSISDTVVSVPTVDIGIAQLAMHSSNETMAVSDYCDMIKALTEFYSSSISDLNVK